MAKKAKLINIVPFETIALKLLIKKTIQPNQPFLKHLFQF
jgi:hypothetical protein